MEYLYLLGWNRRIEKKMGYLDILGWKRRIRNGIFETIGMEQEN